MDKLTLNLGWLRLWKTYKTQKGDYFDFLDNVAKPEFLRLYHADPEMEKLNTKSFKIMIVLNRKYQWVKFHRFGLGINEKRMF